MAFYLRLVSSAADIHTCPFQVVSTFFIPMSPVTTKMPYGEENQSDRTAGFLLCLCCCL